MPGPYIEPDVIYRHGLTFEKIGHYLSDLDMLKPKPLPPSVGRMVWMSYNQIKDMDGVSEDLLTSGLGAYVVRVNPMKEGESKP